MPACFHAYDIRGNASAEVTPALGRALGSGLYEVLGFRTIALGYDARLTGPELFEAVVQGFTGRGGAVISLGMCCTEETYWAAQTLDVDGAVMITASHNPATDNGFKIVRKNAVPVSGESGLKELAEFVDNQMNTQKPAYKPEIAENTQARTDFINWLLNYTGAGQGRRLKIVADCGNGCAGLLLRELAKNLPYELMLINEKPDGNFPLGAPNPLLPENRAGTAKAVLEHGADFGIAFDGDADRCFFYDQQGNFIEGYYIVGLLARALLKRHGGEKIIHDPRLYWNTARQVADAGGIPIKGLTGHAFMKDRMRRENAIYGGEMSSHHYFRDFGYCDSGMIPFLLIARLVSESGRSLRELLGESMEAFPCSGEINRKVKDADEVLSAVREKYAPGAKNINLADGLDLEFDDWRFSLRKSNTEPLLRLNVESRANPELMREKTSELLAMIEV